jgi:hypothetical protein
VHRAGLDVRLRPGGGAVDELVGHHDVARRDVGRSPPTAQGAST